MPHFSKYSFPAKTVMLVAECYFMELLRFYRRLFALPREEEPTLVTGRSQRQCTMFHHFECWKHPARFPTRPTAERPRSAFDFSRPGK